MTPNPPDGGGPIIIKGKGGRIAAPKSKAKSSAKNKPKSKK